MSLTISAGCSNRDRRRQRWALGWCVLSLLFVVLGYFACAWQRDELAALSLIPVWCWLVPGLATLLLARRVQPRGWLFVIVMLWTLFTVALIEESRSLSRSVWSRFVNPTPVEPRDLRLRVVSLNCADGSLRTAREVAAVTPDILLFQESPGRNELEKLAADLFGDSFGVLWSPDTSIVARWPITLPEQRDHFVVGRVKPPHGPEFKVVSLRLAPPTVRYDLWNPACWREQTTKRKHHKQQIDQLANLLIDSDNFTIILGGDFNAAQHDRSTQILRNFGHDTFDIAGRGWGNTVLNTIPVLRFDQIWTSGHFRPIATWAIRSEHSDHRMVVSDLVLAAKWRERGRASSPKLR